MRTRMYMYVNINLYDISISAHIHIYRYVSHITYLYLYLMSIYISISPSLRSMSRQGARSRLAIDDSMWWENQRIRTVQAAARKIFASNGEGSWQILRRGRIGRIRWGHFRCEDLWRVTGSKVSKVSRRRIPSIVLEVPMLRISCPAQPRFCDGAKWTPRTARVMGWERVPDWMGIFEVNL